MLPKVVAVVLLSPSKELHCWKCQAALSSALSCSSCGALQEPPDSLSHFDVLGLPASLGLAEGPLREKFYELSKKTHPDRFGQVPPPESLYALRWNTLIN